MRQERFPGFKSAVEIPPKTHPNDPGKCDLCCSYIGERRPLELENGRILKLCCSCHTKSIFAVKPRPSRTIP